MQIRRLGPDDFKASLALRFRALRNNPEAFGMSIEEAEVAPEEDWRSRLKLEGDDAIFAAEVDGELVGMTGFRRQKGRKTQHRAFIWGVYVDPEHRGKGYGRALVQCAIDHARTCKELDLIEISVVTTNQPANALYRSLGFELTGTFPHALRIEGVNYDESFMVMFM